MPRTLVDDPLTISRLKHISFVVFFYAQDTGVVRKGGIHRHSLNIIFGSGSIQATYGIPVEEDSVGTKTDKEFVLHRFTVVPTADGLKLTHIGLWEKKWYPLEPPG